MIKFAIAVLGTLAVIGIGVYCIFLLGDRKRKVIGSMEDGPDLEAQDKEAEKLSREPGYVIIETDAELEPEPEFGGILRNYEKE